MKYDSAASPAPPKAWPWAVAAVLSLLGLAQRAQHSARLRAGQHPRRTGCATLARPIADPSPLFI